MGKEQVVDYYDSIYKTDEHYGSDYLDLPYFQVFETVNDYLKTTINHKILEIGCGTGQLAHYLYDQGYKDYRGFDFSTVAVQKAKELSPQNFFVGDALDKNNYTGEYNIVLAIEILEHLKDDIGIIKLIRPGTEFIFSFPNFNDKAHVRFFKKPQDILNRYSEYCNFRHIISPSCWHVARGVIK